MSEPQHIRIRHEQPGDAGGIRAVNDGAFGQPEESRIIDAVRAAGHVTVSLVAEEGLRIVGHILFTPMTLQPSVATLRLAALGPMAVAPDRQRMHLGTALVRTGLAECLRAGMQAVVVIGHPEFYRRFGFGPASAFGLRSPFEVPDEVFMVAELVPSALKGAAGQVEYVPQFGGA
jgi:putative acetyltransferase